jgi:uncharacterized protein (UPF0332 family)
MQDAKKHLRWCLKQNKGIKIVKPSENLTTAYLRKSRNALKSMDVNAEANITEWTISASYYAKYFAVYALLTKIGAKSEIHDCTIALFEYLFNDIIPEETFKELKHSKEDRIETQYYTQEINIDLQQTMKQTKQFVLYIENTIDNLNPEKTAALQKKLGNLKTE